jgi:hypothetical protein
MAKRPFGTSYVHLAVGAVARGCCSESGSVREATAIGRSGVRDHLYFHPSQVFRLLSSGIFSNTPRSIVEQTTGENRSGEKKAVDSEGGDFRQ